MHIGFSRDTSCKTAWQVEKIYLFDNKYIIPSLDSHFNTCQL